MTLAVLSFANGGQKKEVSAKLILGKKATLSHSRTLKKKPNHHTPYGVLILTFFNKLEQDGAKYLLVY